MILNKLGTFCDPEDQSIKCVFENKDGNIIEMTLLQNRQERDVVCVPTHYFCGMGCKMCHLTNFMSNKLMLPIKIDEWNEALLRTVCHDIDGKLMKRTYKKDILISFMGVGEPLMNVELIKKVFNTNKLINKGLYENVSYALATMFPLEDRFDDLFEFVKFNKVPLKIHYSMHFPDDENRQNLIPASNVSLDKILERLNDYFQYFEENEMGNFKKFHKHGAVELHYTLIDGVNDHFWCQQNIRCMLNKYPFGLKFINFNPIGDMKRSVKTEDFINSLRCSHRNRIKFYCPPGKNVGASCGEFTRHYFINQETEEEKREFEEWKEKYCVEEKIIDML